MLAKQTLIAISAASILNLSLWFWTPSLKSHEAASAPIRQAESPFGRPMSSTQCAVPLPSVAAPRELSQSGVRLTEKISDQPWLSTVRDSVMQLSMSPKFADKLIITGMECAGSKCEITGSTKLSGDGHWNGSPEVASLMNTMNDGEIAGGNSGRLVGLHQIKPARDGVEFSMTVEDHTGPPPINPCQSVLDRWKDMHPEDWTNNRSLDKS